MNNIEGLFSNFIYDIFLYALSVPDVLSKIGDNQRLIFKQMIKSFDLLNVQALSKINDIKLIKCYYFILTNFKPEEKHLIRENFNVEKLEQIVNLFFEKDETTKFRKFKKQIFEELINNEFNSDELYAQNEYLRISKEGKFYTIYMYLMQILALVISILPEYSKVLYDPNPASHELAYILLDFFELLFESQTPKIMKYLMLRVIGNLFIKGNKGNNESFKMLMNLKPNLLEKFTNFWVETINEIKALEEYAKKNNKTKALEREFSISEFFIFHGVLPFVSHLVENNWLHRIFFKSPSSKNVSLTIMTTYIMKKTGLQSGSAIDLSEKSNLMIEKIKQTIVKILNFSFNINIMDRKYNYSFMKRLINVLLTHRSIDDQQKKPYLSPEQYNILEVVNEQLNYFSFLKKSNHFNEINNSNLIKFLLDNIIPTITHTVNKLVYEYHNKIFPLNMSRNINVILKQIHDSNFNEEFAYIMSPFEDIIIYNALVVRLNDIETFENYIGNKYERNVEDLSSYFSDVFFQLFRDDSLCKNVIKNIFIYLNEAKYSNDLNVYHFVKNFSRVFQGILHRYGAIIFKNKLIDIKEKNLSTSILSYKESKNYIMKCLQEFFFESDASELILSCFSFGMKKTIVESEDSLIFYLNYLNEILKLSKKVKK